MLFCIHSHLRTANAHTVAKRIEVHNVRIGIDHLCAHFVYFQCEVFKNVRLDNNAKEVQSVLKNADVKGMLREKSIALLKGEM